MSKGAVFSIIAASLALALAALAYVKSGTPPAQEDDGGLAISGWFNNLPGLTLAPPASRLARKAKSLGVAPAVTDETLRAVLEAVTDRALGGDVEAAAVLFELAAIQRAKPAAPAEAEKPKPTEAEKPK